LRYIVSWIKKEGGRDVIWTLAIGTGMAGITLLSHHVNGELLSTLIVLVLLTAAMAGFFAIVRSDRRAPEPVRVAAPPNQAGRRPTRRPRLEQGIWW
jgi:hypothetical protein